MALTKTLLLATGLSEKQHIFRRSMQQALGNSTAQAVAIAQPLAAGDVNAAAMAIAAASSKSSGGPNNAVAKALAIAVAAGMCPATPWTCCYTHPQLLQGMPSSRVLACFIRRVFSAAGDTNVAAQALAQATSLGANSTALAQAAAVATSGSGSAPSSTTFDHGSGNRQG